MDIFGACVRTCCCVVLCIFGALLHEWVTALLPCRLRKKEKARHATTVQYYRQVCYCTLLSSTQHCKTCTPPRHNNRRTDADSVLFPPLSEPKNTLMPVCLLCGLVACAFRKATFTIRTPRPPRHSWPPLQVGRHCGSFPHFSF